MQVFELPGGPSRGRYLSPVRSFLAKPPRFGAISPMRKTLSHFLRQVVILVFRGNIGGSLAACFAAAAGHANMPKWVPTITRKKSMTSGRKKRLDVFYVYEISRNREGLAENDRTGEY